jgi:DNA-binding CsgD family transcriptional regulator
MAALSGRDYRAILELVEELHGCLSFDTFAHRLVHALPRIIRSDYCTINDVDVLKPRVRWVANRDPKVENGPEIFARHMQEHPFICHRHAAYATHVPAALSDFVGQIEWHDGALYNEFYHPSAIEHMLGVPLAVDFPRELQVVVFRGDRDFDTRERRVLGLLGPHLSAAVHHVEAVDALASEVEALRNGLETDGRAVIALGPGRRLRHISARARGWLATYFAPHPRDAATLPAAVDQWLRQQELCIGEAGAPRQPLVTERCGGRLTIRALWERGAALLVLSEQRLQIGRDDLVSLGLSPRETEVLAWLASGKTNGAMAEILGLSPLTIKHCVERIYAKLGVGTRASATAIAVAAAGVRH